MSSKVGALLIDMAMNTAAFASDLSKTQSSLNSWASSSNKTLSNVVNGWRGVSKEIDGFIGRTFNMRNAILSLVGGGVFGALINKQIELASAIVDTADNIGLSTKTLQEYTYAGRLSSIGTEQMQDAMKKFAVSVGQARAESGKFYQYLSANNPELLKQVLASKSLDEALNATFSTMGKLTNEQDRLALAQAAFSKTNLNMVNLVKDGTGAFESMRQKANDLGIVIRDDLLRNAEEAGDKIDTLSQVFRAQLMVAVAENAKEIGNFAEELTKLLPVLVELATKAMQLVNVLVDEWEPATIKIGTAMAVMALKTQAAFEAVSGLITGNWSEAEQKIKDLNALADGVADEAADRLQKISQGAQGISGGVDAAAGTGAAARSAEDYAERMRDAAKATKDAGEEFKKLKSAADKIKEDVKSPFEKYISDIAELDKMLKANLITWDEYQRAVTKAQDKNFQISDRTKKVLGEQETAQDKYNEKMKELNALVGVEGGLSWEQYEIAVGKANAELRKAQNEGSLFSDLMDKAIDGNIKSWKDLGRAVIDFGKQWLKTLAAGQSAGGSGGGFGGGGIFGSLVSLGSSLWSSYSLNSSIASTIAANPAIFHSGGVVGSAGGSSRRVDASVFAGAPRFHNGGLVGGEVPAILKKGERVLTEQQQKEELGGTVVYNIDARGAAAGVADELRQMIRDVNASVESRSVAAVTSARARNPNLFGG
jgi:hypothetical protein